MGDYPLIGLIIGYTCVGVFVATAFAVVLDMFGRGRLPSDVRSMLYKALVVEVVVICVGWFASIAKFNPQPVKAEIANEAKQQVVEKQVIPLEHKIDQLQTPVYLQIADESQRPIAKRVTESLKQLGFNVRGTENVGPKNSPSASEVRFYSGNEQFPAYSQSISNAMKAAGLSDVQVKPSDDKSFGGNIEVWISKSAEPTINGFNYAVAVNQDDVLKDAQVHLQEMLLDKKLPDSYILYRPEDHYRTVRLFATREQADEFMPVATAMNNTVSEPKQLSVWCPSPRWNKEGKFFACQ